MPSLPRAVLLDRVRHPGKGAGRGDEAVTQNRYCLQRMIRRLAVILCLAWLPGCGPSRTDRIVVGCKNFTEQLILGEIIAQQIENQTHLPVERRFYLAGTLIAQQSILAGRIDIYPEYTGTALTAVLKETPASRADVYQQVKAE